MVGQPPCALPRDSLLYPVPHPWWRSRLVPNAALFPPVLSQRTVLVSSFLQSECLANHTERSADGITATYSSSGPPAAYAQVHGQSQDDLEEKYVAPFGKKDS